MRRYFLNERLRWHVLILLALASFWAVVWFWSNFTESGMIDACLDDGGAWSYEQSKCEGARSSP